jgi:hypothetical protein
MEYDLVRLESLELMRDREDVGLDPVLFVLLKTKLSNIAYPVSLRSKTSDMLLTYSETLSRHAARKTLMKNE